MMHTTLTIYSSMDSIGVNCILVVVMVHVSITMT
jgi:hypothetical protein